MVSASIYIFSQTEYFCARCSFCTYLHSKAFYEAIEKARYRDDIIAQRGQYGYQISATSSTSSNRRPKVKEEAGSPKLVPVCSERHPGSTSTVMEPTPTDFLESTNPGMKIGTWPIYLDILDEEVTHATDVGGPDYVPLRG